MKTRNYFFPLLVLISYTVPLFVIAYNSADPNNAINLILYFVNRLVVLLIAVATLVFLYGVVQYVIAKGDEKQLATGRTYMLYGIIGLVVMVGVWGFVNLLIYTIFGGRGTFEPNVRPFGTYTP